MNILQRINEIEDKFKKLDSWEDRYKEIINLGKSLEVMEEGYKLEKFKVKGCQSQVWLAPVYKDQKLYFQADSDSLLVKGIAALLLDVFSGHSIDDILEAKQDFLSNIGMTQHLSMNRTNGLASMVKQIKYYAIAFKALKDSK